MTADLVYLVAGGALLLAVVLPQLLRKWAVSAPMVLVVVGMLIGLTPLPDGMPLDPQQNRATIEHVTELTVLIALMGVGLALDRPLNLLRRASWGGWSPTWRLLAVSMPVTIGAVALLGWWVAGLAPALALLLGAVLAPTDPVLASDVQVAGPRTESHDHEVEEDDEVRFSLTSEAGLNDGLAFPFVYAAILLASEGAVDGWVLEWVGWYLVGKVVIGVAVGIAVGRALAHLAFRSRREVPSVAERGESLMVLAALISAYGVGEVAGGYGFLSVFACAMTLRSAERSHDYHKAMHEVVERLERLFTLFVLLVLGIALTRGPARDARLARGGRRGRPGRRHPAARGLPRARALGSRPLRAGRHDEPGDVGHLVLRRPRCRLALLPGLRRGRVRRPRCGLDVVDRGVHPRAVGDGARRARDAGDETHRPGPRSLTLPAGARIP